MIVIGLLLFIIHDFKYYSCIPLKSQACDMFSTTSTCIVIYINKLYKYKIKRWFIAYKFIFVTSLHVQMFQLTHENYVIIWKLLAIMLVLTKLCKNELLHIFYDVHTTYISLLHNQITNLFNNVCKKDLHVYN